MLQNYFPLPTNRKKRAKLNKMKNSNALVFNGIINNNNSININRQSKKQSLSQILELKNLK